MSSPSGMVMPSQGRDSSWLPEGMDPKSSYLLKIRLVGNPKKRRKEFSCFRCSKVVDSDLCNFKDLVEEIVDHYPHGYNEIVHFFYYDGAQKTFPKVTTDQGLLEMFSKHVHGKIVHLTIAFTEPNESYTPEPDNEALHSDDIPCTPSLVSPSIATASLSTDHATILMLPNQPPKPTASHFTDPPSESDDDDDDDDGYLANPEPHNEHVGVDDDGLYLLDHKETREGKESKSDYESDSESQSDEEYTEEDGLIGADPLPPIPIVAYDKDDPPMRVGSIYPNIIEFRLALSQHAIKHGFEFNTEKSDLGRLRAYCSRKEEEGCRWRLHASTMKDNITVKVKKNRRAHTCTSVRISKQVKNATKFWICEQVKDWLMEDATVGAKELQRRIKDKHKVELPYKRVHAESSHDFFMHPPLLKATAGRRHNKRYKGSAEAGGSTTRKKGSHQCPICKGYGHRWYNCKNGDPEDIAAMQAMKGPPKKKKKPIEPTTESSIVPVDPAPKKMIFPASQGTSVSLSSGNSLRSGKGSNQPEPLSLEFSLFSSGETTPPPTTSMATGNKKAEGKVKAVEKKKNKAAVKKKKKEVPVPPESPAMCTRSKTPQRSSSASHTRSKRKLPDLNL